MRTNRSQTMILAAATAGALLLAACGGSAAENEVAAIDNEIAKADIDPAISTAIEDEILVDPTLVQQSNPNGVRHPERPLQAPYPTRAGAGANEANGATPAAEVNSPCGVPFQFGAEWAERMPAEFPAYPGGRVSEAAGSDRGECHARVVTFATDHGWQQVLDFYRAAVTRAGYDAEHERKEGDHLLGGTNGSTGAAYLVIVTPEGSGSKVSLIVGNGR
jgi:hypothetical protein